MTTIAYKDGTVAYDSRVTSGGFIDGDSENKRFHKDGVTFFVSGLLADTDMLMKEYFKERRGVVRPSQVAALVVDNGQIFHFAYDQESEGYVKAPISCGSHYSIGSGYRHAYTAMDLGFSARVAVEMAAKRDVHTGGEIKSFKFKVKL